MTNILFIAIIVASFLSPKVANEPVGEIPENFNDCPDNMNCAIEEIKK